MIEQKICAWGGPFCAVLFGAGLLIAGFVPPPSPLLSAGQVAAIYRDHAMAIRCGMILGMFGMSGYAALVCAISVQMRRMRTSSSLPADMQLGAGAIGVLTVMFPTMLMAITAFRPERDPALTQLLNDTAWLLIIPAFPTFIAQFGAIAIGAFTDTAPEPVFPRWAGYLNLWLALLFVPGAFSYIFRSGPFAWDGLLAFWVAAGAFFVWLMTMTPLTLKAIGRSAA
ncbi:MAG: hypothetical protein RIS94_3412 [Pseudomonadota bacterium]|jgi:hypothetical protein